MDNVQYPYSLLCLQSELHFHIMHPGLGIFYKINPDNLETPLSYQVFKNHIKKKIK